MTKHRKPHEHGTYAGALRHRVDGTELCEPCREARNAYRREHYARRGRKTAKMYRQTREQALLQLAALHPYEYEKILARLRLAKRTAA